MSTSLLLSLCRCQEEAEVFQLLCRVETATYTLTLCYPT